MEWLNYHHLLYFWTVARLSSVSRAGEELHLTQATVSAQLKSLEGSLGEKLFRKTGRHLILTETGKVVFRYADEIFSLGREMMGTLKGRPQGRSARLTVGVADQIVEFYKTCAFMECIVAPEFDEAALPKLQKDRRGTIRCRGGLARGGVRACD